MKCPHCHKSFHSDWKITNIGYCGKNEHYSKFWKSFYQQCPACSEAIIGIGFAKDYGGGISRFDTEWLVFPKAGSRSPAPSDVPEAIAADYNEACLVIADSPTASAALSRRCLQNLLLERNVSKSDNLSKAIDDALKSGIPTQIAENLDAVRNVGNFAAHPQKSLHSGEILSVEPHEAEWNLDVLESLFDFYYVQPAVSRAKRAALDKKLAEVGKPPMK